MTSSLYCLLPDVARALLTATLMPMAVIMFVLNLKADVSDLQDPNADDPCCENLNSFASSVFLSWLTPLIWLGYKKPLVQADLSR